MNKVCISIKESHSKEIDAICKRENITRSRFIQTALTFYFAMKDVYHHVEDYSKED